MKHSQAQMIREYGPFPGIDNVHGVTFDGTRIWFAAGPQIHAVDPETGEIVRSLDAQADAGTAFDGEHLWQIAEDRIDQIRLEDGVVIKSLPAPGHGGDSGLAWAEGYLWVGQHLGKVIYQVDPSNGRIIRTIPSDSIVTGVCFFGGELWHGTWENDRGDIRRIDKASGQVLEKIEMAEGCHISGLESDGKDTFFAGGGSQGKIRAVRVTRPAIGS